MFSILQLDGKAKLNTFVSILKIPTRGDDVKAGTKCEVTGWGLTKNKGKASDTLREVTVTIIDRKTCSGPDYYNNEIQITKNNLCAGDSKGGKDACQVSSIMQFGHGYGNSGICQQVAIMSSLLLLLGFNMQMSGS